VTRAEEDRRLERADTLNSCGCAGQYVLPVVKGLAEALRLRRAEEPTLEGGVKLDDWVKTMPMVCANCAAFRSNRDGGKTGQCSTRAETVKAFYRCSSWAPAP
jgi:hypothetical protein